MNVYRKKTTKITINIKENYLQNVLKCIILKLNTNIKFITQ